MRGTTNRNERGNTRDRAARKRWLLEVFQADRCAVVYNQSGCRWVLEAQPACRCYRCGDLLNFDLITVDRIIPGAKGGTYRRNNIRPACAECNSETGGAVRS